MVLLIYLSNFWRTLEMPLIICEINLYLHWSKNCVIVANHVNVDSAFSITDPKLYVPVVTLSTQNNAKILEQFKSCTKRIINWNTNQWEYQQKEKINI